MTDYSFRDGIINLHTRQFGRVVELIVQLLRDYQDSMQLDHDLFDPKGGQKIEVKSSRVFRRQKLKFDLDNLYDLIVNNSNRNRLLEQSQATKVDFDCNIQQIEIEPFDTPYYLLFFSDNIEVFKLEKGQISSDKNLGYSEKQHRGNEGEGQFHIHGKNYQYHKDNYYVQTISYNEIKEKLVARAKEREPLERNQP